MSGIRDRLHSAEGRVVAGATLIAALVVGLWPDPNRPFDPEKAGAILVAVVLWLYAELGGAPSPSKLDIELHRRIKEVMDDSALTFLRDHDFGGSLRDSQTQPIGIVCSWHGANAEFRDTKVQAAWASCREKMKVLDRLYAEHLNPTHRGDRLTAVSHNSDEWNIPRHILEAIDALNLAAAATYKSFNDFDRIARNRLNL